MAEPETTEPETTTTEAELPPEQETRIVEKVVDRVKGVIKEIVGEPAPDEGEEEGVSDDSLSTSEPSSPRQQESQMEDMVRSELAKIGAMEEQAKINEHVKAEMERPPVAMKKVTQFLWGGAEK